MNEIFLIDDDHLVNFLNQEIIKEAYPQQIVKAFDNVIDAIEYFRLLANTPASENSTKFIFLDINMPVLDGWDFLDLFEQLPATVRDQCKVVMHTSSIDPRDIDKAKTYKSVTDYISKPLTPQILAKVFLS